MWTVIYNYRVRHKSDNTPVRHKLINTPLSHERLVVRGIKGVLTDLRLTLYNCGVQNSWLSWSVAYPKKFFGGGGGGWFRQELFFGGFKKFSSGQRAERTEIWGR
jgi:hypothetical protein